MSYILEALRRAEAERQQRDPADLNQPPAPRPTWDDGLVPGQRRGASRLSRPMRVGAAVAAALAVGLAGWWLGRAKAPAPAVTVLADAAPRSPAVATPMVEAAQPVPTPAPAMAPPVLVVPPPSAPTAEPAAAAAPSRAPEPTPPARLREPTRPSPPPKAEVAPGPGNALARAPATAASPPKPVSAVLPAIPAWAALDPAARAAWPALSFGGAMHSPDPAQRIVIVNGDALREGQAVAAGVVIERIHARSVVLRRGEGPTATRVEMPF